MTHSLSDMWNERYRQKEFVYGEAPNVYLQEQLPKFPVGKVLFPAEGEGRNAVFAAKKSWTVSAFDISGEAKRKALQLAEKNNVTIDYKVGELHDLDYRDNEFDAIVLIFAHFSPHKRSEIHKTLDSLLRKGGIVIFEGFGKKQIDYQRENENAGGPKNVEMLFSAEEIQSDFSNYDIIELTETEVNLNEGLYHQGLGAVVRFVGRKR